MIDNIYVRFRSYLFRQAIPMGTHYSPLFLFLHPFEYDFILNTMKQDMTRAIWLSNTFRYMDDLFSVNNEEFGNDIYTIYPSESELKDTSTSQRMRVTSTRGSSVTTTHLSMSASTIRYDRRDDFTFRIANFPYMDSNISTKPAYSVHQHI